jgi:fatty-acyl-CoA synthase
LHTGDLGRFDEDGFLYIVGRKKDLIITGGFNVFPREVEDVLSAHADVEQAVVFGLPDERWGEAVNAAVVLRSGVKQSDELSDSLIDLVKTAKGSVQAPKAIHFLESIPLTPVGKPNKQQIISMYQA